MRLLRHPHVPASPDDPAGGSEAVGGVASRRLEPLLTGPRRRGEVRGVCPSALYLEFGEEIAAVVARDAVRLPISVVLAASTASLPFTGVAAGQLAMVGAGRMSAGAFEVRVGRWWNPRQAPALVRPEHLLSRAARLGRMLRVHGHTLSPRVAAAAGSLAEALDGTGPLTIGADLIGLGEGLTPSGDDVLCGVLLALRHLGRPAYADRLWEVLAGELTGRTTALSATLLAAAAAGDAVPEAVDVLAGLAGHRPLEPAVDRLLGVGATSGSDLAHGLLVGALASAP